ncbi:hypothetical protein BH11PLA1_BH11PLA1_01580 [soil metagenome]
MQHPSARRLSASALNGGVHFITSSYHRTGIERNASPGEETIRYLGDG